jgi:formylglycine-generating enzyme required for sulfatase activity
VGSFPSNAWGLHDMHGNVWEWCQDDYRDNYDGAPVDGSAREHTPVGIGKSRSRAIRGGSWSYGSKILRSANRDHAKAGARQDDLGFRVARTLHP